MRLLQTRIIERLEQTNEIVNSFLLFKNILPEDYYWKQFADDYMTRHNITLIQNIKGINLNCYSAFTVKSNHSTAIFVNNKIVAGRQHFSICHELIHHIFDLLNTKQSQQFFGIAENPSLYKEEELETERLANAGAGILMLPDIVLLTYLEKNISFHTIARESGMTEAALNTRLIQFLELQANLRAEYALKLANEFRYYGKKETLVRTIEGWNLPIKKQIITTYENAKKETYLNLS